MLSAPLRGFVDTLRGRHLFSAPAGTQATEEYQRLVGEARLAFWDNRATAHVAPTDIFDLDFDRQLYRITLEGEVPVGVDGQPSRALEGHPLLAHHTGNQ